MKPVFHLKIKNINTALRLTRVLLLGSLFLLIPGKGWGQLSVSPTATPGTVCAGASVQLLASASGGTGTPTYTWTSVPEGFTSDLANPIANPIVTTTYYIAVTDELTTVNSQVTVTVNTLPVVDAIGDGSTTVCVNSATPAFTNTTVGGFWSIVPGTGAASITSLGVVTGLTAGSVNVIYTTIPDVNGCKNSSSTPLTVNPLPTTSPIYHQ